MHVLELLVLSVLFYASNYGTCQEVTDSQLKESDIIKITVEKKETTKSLTHDSTRNKIKTPMTILPFKGKPIRHTAAPVNMVEPSSKLSGKISDERQEIATSTSTSAFESFETFQEHNAITEFPENDLEASGSDNLVASEQDIFENITDIIDASMNQTDGMQMIEDFESMGFNYNSTPSYNLTTYKETNQSAENGEKHAHFSTEVVPTESGIDGYVDSETIKEESSNSHLKDYEQLCEHSGNGRLQYVWGDAFSNTDCLGPNMQRYPTEIVDRMFQDKWKRLRQKRETKDPLFMRDQLLSGWLNANRDLHQSNRMMKSTENEIVDTPKCPGQVKKLCQSDYNTTAPIFGMSMTTGQPVAIVQKFPDLLQQVIYEVCLSDECAVVHGKCANTYIPYLFLTIPLGPVTLTGQDYILVESGCSCKPDP